MLAIPLSLALLSGGGGSDLGDRWSFPEATLEVGARLPNWLLPRIEGGAPVPLYDLIDGKPTLLHIYAAW